MPYATIKHKINIAHTNLSTATILDGIRKYLKSITLMDDYGVVTRFYNVRINDKPRIPMRAPYIVFDVTTDMEYFKIEEGVKIKIVVSNVMEYGIFWDSDLHCGIITVDNMNGEYEFVDEGFVDSRGNEIKTGDTISVTVVEFAVREGRYDIIAKLS